VHTEEDPEQNEAPSTGRHAAREGAPPHPAIDLSRDPHPGKPDHAKPDDEYATPPGALVFGFGALCRERDLSARECWQLTRGLPGCG
jgi:hypothetical protein